MIAVAFGLGFRTFCCRRASPLAVLREPSASFHNRVRARVGTPQPHCCTRLKAVSGLLRTLLMWLLALAIPTQGFATSTMLFCDPVHHGGTASLTAAAHVQAIEEVDTGSGPSSASRSDHHRYSTEADTPPTARQRLSAAK